VPHHQLPAGTHTVELDQLRELNARLTAMAASPLITAGDLGLAGAACQPEVGAAPKPQAVPEPGALAATLPASAVLARLGWDGPPEYPYIHGIFVPMPVTGSGSLVVEVHTAALVRLSHRFGLHHRWGI